MSDDLTKESFKLILHAGNGRAHAMEAIKDAKEGAFKTAEEKLTLASEELTKAHTIQTSFIQNEINTEESEINLLLVHAQDHLMTAMTVKDLAIEIIELHRLNHIN